MSNWVFSQAAMDVLLERQRQVEIEGWTPEHDDEHREGGLAFAAACYAGHAGAESAILSGTDADGARFVHRIQEWVRYGWPWGRSWWKPAPNLRRNLVKAGALILAEIERLDRAEEAKA